jgi:hypothetical protein
MLLLYRVATARRLRMAALFVLQMHGVSVGMNGKLVGTQTSRAFFYVA